jgi:hypothetical protein
MGIDEAKRGRRDRTVTNRTMSRRMGCLAKWPADISLTISRPSQTMISVPAGTFDASSARSCDRVIGRRITNVPAAPILTTSRCQSCLASAAGRKIR